MPIGQESAERGLIFGMASAKLYDILKRYAILNIRALTTAVFISPFKKMT